MQAHRRQAVIGSLRLIVILLALVFTPTNAVSECRFVPQESVSAPISTLWEFERQCEFPDEATVGRMIYRSNAVESRVHGQFGCEETQYWPAKSGHVKYNDIDIPPIDDLGLIVRYSKNSYSFPDVPIEIYVDDELRASFIPTRTWNWNAFTSTTRLPLGSVDHGLHSIMFSTVGQRYGVADLDEFALAGHQQFRVFLPLVVRRLCND